MRDNIQLGAGIRQHVSDEGRVLIADPPTPDYRGSFWVTRSGFASVRVGSGRCDKQVPLIDDQPIDGMKRGVQGPVPELQLDDGPNENFESWIMLDVEVDLSTGFAKAYTVVHSNVPVLRSNGLILDDGLGHGRREIALVLWNQEGTVKRIIQDLYFDQTHSFKAGVAEGKGQHFFSSSP